MNRFLLFPLLVPLSASAQAQLPSSLAARFEKTLASPTFAHSTVGIQVKSLDSGKLLYSRNPNTSLMPASNLKLITGAAALALLGSEFRYETRVLRQGDDLVLQGAGDPSLDFERLKKLAAAVKEAGVTELTGKLILDASCFDEAPLGDGWQWDDEAFYFSAQVSGLCCDENVVPVTLKAGGVVETHPYLLVEKELTTISSKASSVSFDRKRGQNVVVIRGKLGTQTEPIREVVTVEDPAQFTGVRFLEALKLAAVVVPEMPVIVKGKAAAEASRLASDSSAPLRELAKRFMKPSDNLYGECFLKTIGYQKGKVGTSAEGARLVRAWLQSRRLDTGGFHQADGSGLSRMNLVTSKLLLGLLADQASEKAFYDALPIGGVDGTLRNRFKNTPAARNVRAKTGTLTGASSLSGYVRTKEGERLAFSILMNHYERAAGSGAARAAQDALVLTLLELPRRRK